MPAKKKTAAKKKPTPKATYVCVPCGLEVTVNRQGIGATRIMCCGEVMKRKVKKTSR